MRALRPGARLAQLGIRLGGDLRADGVRQRRQPERKVVALGAGSPSSRRRVRSFET
jgi:hypothetical protein